MSKRDDKRKRILDIVGENEPEKKHRSKRIGEMGEKVKEIEEEIVESKQQEFSEEYSTVVMDTEDGPETSTAILTGGFSILYGIYIGTLAINIISRDGARIVDLIFLYVGAALVIAGYGIGKTQAWGFYLGGISGVALLLVGVYFLPSGIVNILMGLLLLSLIYSSRDEFKFI